MTVWKSHGLRGDALEALLLKTNDYYRSKQLARIDKIHVPVKVVELDEKGIISKAYFEKKSTIDFQGVIQGVGIAFEAKETHQKSLPLYNIHDHQVEFMRDIDLQGGLTFIIVHFKFNDTFYLIPYEVVAQYYRETKRKSIPFSAMEERYKIELAAIGILNYLPALNAYVNEKTRKKASSPDHGITQTDTQKPAEENAKGNARETAIEITNAKPLKQPQTQIKAKKKSSCDPH
jgi:recombination protein U